MRVGVVVSEREVLVAEGKEIGHGRIEDHRRRDISIRVIFVVPGRLHRAPEAASITLAGVFTRSKRHALSGAVSGRFLM